MSSSLKRAIERLNSSEIKNIRNRRETNLKKTKNKKLISPFGYKDNSIKKRKSSVLKKSKAVNDAYRIVGVGYNIKQRKKSNKRKKSEKSKKRKKTDPNWKKRSIGSETSRSRKKKSYGKASRSGTRKLLSQSKCSDKNFNGSQNSGFLKANKSDK